MSFVLSAQREDNVVRAFERYRTYLQTVRRSLPASVFGLASSDWYFSPQEHRCPHDAWLESGTISEPSSGERHELRTTSIRTRLLGAFRNGFIEFIYPQVFRYSLEALDSSTGHRDWRYDEFRLSNCGHVIHEIEWCGAHDTARWVIECADVQFLWHPNQGA